MHFPQFVSFTVTNACNLRCHMCGQWSEEGYIRNKVQSAAPRLGIEDWMRLTDEIANYPIRFVLIRGGEPFLFPGIVELIKHIHRKGLFISLDTNGTLLDQYAKDIAGLGNMHMTFSVDGPEEVHDLVRGVKGSFQKTKANIALLDELEKNCENKISKSVCFTISQYNYRSLGKMPDVVRDLGLRSINIVPYYYCSQEVGKIYEQELRDYFDTPAYSWKGFHHDESGIDFEIFKNEYQKYLDGLGEIENYPYMPMTEKDYETWFKNAWTQVGPQACHNVERLIDIQPDGHANFCVDFPDVSIGNVRESSIGEIWRGPKAQTFRAYRREKPLAICRRCGAKFMSGIN